MKIENKFLNRMWLLLKHVFSTDVFGFSRVKDRNDSKSSLAWDRDENVISVQVIINHECVKFPFILRNQTSDVPIFEQIFIHQEYNFNVKKQPSMVVDAGANIGLASIYFASKYPNANLTKIGSDIKDKNDKKHEVGWQDLKLKQLA